MTWRLFLIGHASRIPNIAIMSYAGYLIRRYAENDPIENTNIDMITIKNAYRSNDVTYGFTVTFCIIFALLLLVTSFAMYLQYQRLVLGIYDINTFFYNRIFAIIIVTICQYK